MTQKTRIVTAVLAAFWLATGAAAQSYPSKAITIIVPFPAGASPDLVARAIGQKLNEAWRQPVVIENKPGAGAIIGTETVAKSAPDGYTLLLHSASHAIAPSMYKLPYSTVRDFAPITRVAFVPNMLIIHPTVPVKNVKELIMLARSKPGTLNYSSSGNGSPAHLAGELFKLLAGIDILHIPYRGSPQAIIALLSGETAMMFSPIPIAMPHVKSGKLRVLGVTTAKRSKVLPDLPTISESGLSGYEVTQWYAMQAPAGTPKEVLAKLNGEVRRILSMPDIVERLSAQGAEPAPTTPEVLEAYIKTEIAKWAKVVKASGARVD